MMITIENTCPFCGSRHYVFVDEDHFSLWNNGIELIQNAMPELSPTEREQLISGICPECQKKIFG